MSIIINPNSPTSPHPTSSTYEGQPSGMASSSIALSAILVWISIMRELQCVCVCVVRACVCVVRAWYVCACALITIVSTQNVDISAAMESGQLVH